MEPRYIRDMINAAYGAYCEAWVANGLQELTNSSNIKDKLFNDALFALKKRVYIHGLGGKK